MSHNHKGRSSSRRDDPKPAKPPHTATSSSSPGFWRAGGDCRWGATGGYLVQPHSRSKVFLCALVAPYCQQHAPEHGANSQHSCSTSQTKSGGICFCRSIFPDGRSTRPKHILGRSSKAHMCSVCRLLDIAVCCICSSDRRLCCHEPLSVRLRSAFHSRSAQPKEYCCEKQQDRVHSGLGQWRLVSRVVGVHQVF